MRDEALREYARKNGLGALLYLTKYFQREMDLLHERTAHAEARQHELGAGVAKLHEMLDPQRELLARQAEVLERLGRLEQAISDASLVSLIRRRYRRLKDRLCGTS